MLILKNGFGHTVSRPTATRYNGPSRVGGGKTMRSPQERGMEMDGGSGPSFRDLIIW